MFDSANLLKKESKLGYSPVPDDDVIEISPSSSSSSPPPHISFTRRERLGFWKLIPWVLLLVSGCLNIAQLGSLRFRSLAKGGMNSFATGFKTEFGRYLRSRSACYDS
jgi:hypothetical protein